MEGVLQLARSVLDRAAGGAGELEAYVEHRVVNTVQAGTGGVVRHVGRADTRGLGVRAVHGEHVGYASTADLTEQGIDAVVAQARAYARVSDSDPFGASLPQPSEADPVPGLCLASMTALPLAAKLAMVVDLSHRVTTLDAKVRSLDTAQWRDEHRRVAIASTLGICTAYESAFAELWCDALGADRYGDATDYGEWWGRDPGAVDVEALAAEAVDRTVRLLGPPAASGSIDTVIIDPAVAGLILAAVGRAMTGGALGNLGSPYAGRLGQRVAADLVSLVDDGRCVAGPGGGPVDHEGVPCRRTPLIDRGVLVGALHSTATAASVGADISTGNAGRANHKALPRAAAHVLCLAPSGGGPPRPSDGAYVQQVSGTVAGVSAVSGRVSLGGVGYAVRDGQPVGRLPTVPISTSLLSLLAEVTWVGGDARVVPEGPVLAPTLVWRPPRGLTW